MEKNNINFENVSEEYKQAKFDEIRIKRAHMQASDTLAIIEKVEGQEILRLEENGQIRIKKEEAQKYIQTLINNLQKDIKNVNDKLKTLKNNMEKAEIINELSSMTIGG